MKEDMEKMYKPHWHVVCGKNFGCYAVHESRKFIFFTLQGGVSFMLYKSG